MGGLDNPEHRFEFDLLGGVGVVHAQYLRQKTRGVEVVRAIDSDVHLLEEQNVGRGETLALAQQLGAARCPEQPGFEQREVVALGPEGVGDIADVEGFFHIPGADPEELAEVRVAGAGGEVSGLPGLVVNDRRAPEPLEFLGQRAFRFGIAGERLQFVETREFRFRTRGDQDIGSEIARERSAVLDPRERSVLFGQRHAAG